MKILRSKAMLLAAFMFVSLTAVAESSYDSVVRQSADTVAVTAKPKVYMTRDISSESLVKIYKALGRKASGRVAVKLSTGEPGGNNFLQPALISKLVKEVKGTIVECNTAYGGGRSNTEAHMKAAEEHGFTKIAKVDIMDAEGEVKIPVTGGSHIDYDIVGKNFMNYDFVVVLSHFKGHAMAGFGGAIKNISIGIASANGKRWIHSGGTSTSDWGHPTQEQFLETMAEAGKAVADKCGDRILYISVMNNLSVDCDCDAHPAAPQMGDIGILASLDPVALDKACVDLVRNSSDEGKVHLIERIDSRKGMTTLVHAEEIGLGSQEYELVEMK
ncbi:MAG: ferredoxin [Bacteroides sp. 43_108]|nr:MAG: ferredoxin [Bacteroides sp. 43_108]